MTTRSMEEKIGCRMFLTGVLGLVLTAVLCIFVFHRAFTKQAWQSLANEASEIAAGYAYLDAPEGLGEFAAGGLRITLVAPDGSVLFETAGVSQPENHLARPEIRDALAQGTGRIERASETLGYRTCYYALRLADGNVLRVAQDSKNLWSIFDEALPALLLSCLVLLGAAALSAGLLTRSLVNPVLKMSEDLEHIQEHVPYKELLPFAEAIHSDHILRESNEKLRQEFTANVSHELKTPLTSISGYAELIETGLAKPEDIPLFGQKIHTEASRMIVLVNDILELSHLDSLDAAKETQHKETVDLLDVVRDCAERQKVNAKHAYVALSYLGESAPVPGSRSLLDELCQNLCDNAIRYNRPGGKVQLLTGCTRDGHAYLTVKDTGIGIPKEAQGRVFERFYRVDKSRSKATGGTGLGLAIVKHIVRIHDARITLESQPGQGTAVTVLFETAH